jgi:DNA (cytosine-5)-methyltransferase 1
MTAYYNEIDPYEAQRLRNLIAAGLIAPGDVDERSIEDVRPDDLAGYRQCHFFAGIGGWSIALRLAGVTDDQHVWTGSPPCQPYSLASVAHGGAQGQGDRRHLAPVFVRLIRERKPSTVVGEQVASAIQWGWWDELALALEGEGYACAAAVLRADAVEADHERKRLYWVAHACGEGRQGHQPLQRIPVAAQAAFAKYGDSLAGARRALAGDYAHVLPGDGVSIAVERLRTKGYGNAIVPQVAAAFIESLLSA